MFLKRGHHTVSRIKNTLQIAKTNHVLEGLHLLGDVGMSGTLQRRRTIVPYNGTLHCIRDLKFLLTVFSHFKGPRPLLVVGETLNKGPHRT